MTDTKQIPQRWRETMRYRRRLLTNRRTYLMRLMAAQTKNRGQPYASAKRRLRRIERQIREFNELAQEWGLPTIR